MTNIFTINEICESLEDGNWIESKDQSKDGIRLIQTGNIKSGYFEDNPDKVRYISEKTFNKLNCKEVFEGDILISRLPDPVGRGCILPKLENRSITAVDCAIVKVKKNIINNKYLLYFLQSPQYQFQVNQKVTGTTRSRISRKNLGEINIPVPSLQEQDEIVKRLDKVFENIGNNLEKQSNSIELYDKIYKSKLNQIFSNEFMRSGETELGELSEIISGQSPKGEFINDSEGLEFHQGKKAFSEKFLLDSGKRTQYTTKQIPKNTIVMSVRAPVGPVNITQESICIGRGLAGIIPQGSNLDFLFYYLDSIKEENTGHVGATINSINRNEIMKIKIPNLSISEQETIANQIHQILELKNELVSNSREALTKLNKLKESVLSKEFSYE